MKLTSVHPSIGDVLLNGVYSGDIKAFGPTNDKFTGRLTPEMIQTLKSSGITGNDITSLEIKEEWLMVKGENKLIVHIIGVAPVAKSSDGKVGEPLFWVYYPEARPYFAKQLIAAPGTQPSNLDEVFEGRFFTSKVNKLSQPITAPQTVIE